MKPSESTNQKLEDEEQRTKLQNNSMHKFYTDLAKAMNDAGYSIEETMSQPLDMDWTPSTIKDLLWRKVQIAMTGKHSTKDLTTKQVGEIYEVINRHLCQAFGVHVPFPNKNELFAEMYTDNDVH